MLRLIQNEWMKIFRRPGTFVMIVIMVLAIAVDGAFTKYTQSTNNLTAVERDWQENLQQENEALKRQMLQSNTKQEKQFFKQEIEINKYRIQHNIPPKDTYNMWSFVEEDSNLIILAGVFTIIIAAGIVASEFSWGTIKLLLIRPIKRTKILLSKYLTVILYAVCMLAILFIFSTALGAVLFGAPEKFLPYLNYLNGNVTEQNLVVHLIIYYFSNSIEMVMLGTMAFMISSVFRNSSLAIGLSLFLLFTGSTFTSLLAINFSWAKYSLFANTDLMQYVEGTPLVEGMTLPFSISILAVYFVIFLFLSFYAFRKRDIAG